jgi:hypothetical protein
MLVWGWVMLAVFSKSESWGWPVYAVFFLFGSGIELECADFRRRVASPALSVTEWVPSSTMATFLHAPLRSRTVGFPESGSDLGSTTHLAFPMRETLKCSVHIHATIHRCAKRARSYCEDGLASALCPRSTLERPR